MEIKVKPMGMYQTNCYIVTVDEKDIVVDPGVDATNWVLQNVSNPIAILNTHGHFDHVWSNAELQEKLNIPLYTPKDDAPMLIASDYFPELPPSVPDVLVEPDEEIDIQGIKVKFHHFAGHCPGCSMIEIGDVMFSGDFIFKDSVGRYDFPYSSQADMKNSLEKFLTLEKDYVLYPGHGGATTIKDEQKNTPLWLMRL
ncbi:MAG: MBL fold metallo-hydrolase [Campylobacterota bacterium]|nr:MBL fold metallo-hydrolase [Campylobacterota bacterium]